MRYGGSLSSTARFGHVNETLLFREKGISVKVIFIFKVHQRYRSSYSIGSYENSVLFERRADCL